jgi:hypothetical protein
MAAFKCDRIVEASDGSFFQPPVSPSAKTDGLFVYHSSPLSASAALSESSLSHTGQ